MKPPPFEYFAPDTVEESLELLQRYGDEAKVLAGGQSLIPVLNFRLARPGVLVDLNRIGALATTAATKGGLRIGAMVRQAAMERDPEVRTAAPLLAEALPYVAHPQIRNRGTLGGSLAHADPAAELPAVILALDARLRVRSARGDRHLAAAEFYTGLFSTALAADEVLVDVEISANAERTGVAFEEVARRHGDFALLGIAAVLRMDADQAVRDARVVAVNTTMGAQRLRSVEVALVGRRANDAALFDAGEAAALEVAAGADVHASAAYRRQLARVLVRRALTRAAARATG